MGWNLNVIINVELQLRGSMKIGFECTMLSEIEGNFMRPHSTFRWPLSPLFSHQFQRQDSGYF